MSRDYLNELKTALTPLDANLQRGTSSMIDDDVWDYMIYGRDTRRASSIDRSETFFVTIVREIEIPEDVIQSVINAVLKIPGFRISDTNMQFDYLQIGNTKNVAESVKIFFVKNTKGF